MKSTIQSLQVGMRCSIRVFASLIGTLVSTCPAVAYGTLFSKILEKEKQMRLIINVNDFNSLMKIPKSCKSDLGRRNKIILESYSPIRTKKFKLTIFTDASTT